MVSNSPGSVVDLSDEEHRALTMSLWSIAPLNGPVTGPLIGGFVYDYLGWRWDNWVVLIIAGFSTLLMLTVRETYAPAILKGRARQLRKETGDSRWWCRYEQSDVSTWELIKLNLSRPFVLSFTEPILWFFNIWISIIYGYVVSGRVSRRPKREPGVLGVVSHILLSGMLSQGPALTSVVRNAR